MYAIICNIGVCAVWRYSHTNRSTANGNCCRYRLRVNWLRQ